LDHLEVEEELVIRYLLGLLEVGTERLRPTAPQLAPVADPTRARPRFAKRRDGVSAAAVGRQLLDYAVAKLRPLAEGGVRVTYLLDAGEVHNAALSGIDSVLETGTHKVILTEDGRSDEFELTIHRRGDTFDLTIANDAVTAHGLGIIDPEFPEALLVSWSWGTELATGIVKYVIGDEPHTIVPTYTSLVLAASGFDGVKGGRATGLTTNGFPGTYSIVYEGIDVTYGPFAWTISERGSALELTWDTGTRRAMEGFGFHDPDNNRSIVVVYWSVGPRLRMPRPPADKSAQQQGGAR
jgi:hypothetical protein